MSLFTVEVRDTDGNDCTVYQVLVDCDSAEEAREQAFDWAMREAPEGTEEDGDFGGFYPCDCDDETPTDCEHGGFTVGEPMNGDHASTYNPTVRLNTIAPSPADLHWATLTQTERQTWRKKFYDDKLWGLYRKPADLAHDRHKTSAALAVFRAVQDR